MLSFHAPLNFAAGFFPASEENWNTHFTLPTRLVEKVKKTFLFFKFYRASSELFLCHKLVINQVSISLTCTNSRPWEMAR